MLLLNRTRIRANQFCTEAPASKKMTSAFEDLLPFRGLSMKDVTLVQDIDMLQKITKHLIEQKVVGFDTESRPSFRKAVDPYNGPHLVQFATRDKAFLLPLRSLSSPIALNESVRKSLRLILESKIVRKVGFGLENDIILLKKNLDITPSNMTDLSLIIRLPGEADDPLKNRSHVGTSKAAGHVLKVRFNKVKSITLSDWSKPIDCFTERQILYAANDAYIALLVYEQWRHLQQKNNENLEV